MMNLDKGALDRYIMGESQTHTDEAAQRCKNGHEWQTPMLFELGGAFYIDEDYGPLCPTCGEWDTEAAKTIV